MKEISQHRVCTKNENYSLNKLLYCLECSENKHSKENVPCKSLTHAEYSILQCPFRKNYDCFWEGHIDSVLSHLREKHGGHIFDEESYFFNFKSLIGCHLFHQPNGLIVIHVNSNLLTLSWSIKKSKNRIVWKGCHLNRNMNADEDLWIQVNVRDGPNANVFCGSLWNVDTINEITSVSSNISSPSYLQNVNIRITKKPKLELADLASHDNGMCYLNNLKWRTVVKKCFKSLKDTGRHWLNTIKSTLTK